MTGNASGSTVRLWEGEGAGGVWSQCGGGSEGWQGGGGGCLCVHVCKRCVCKVCVCVMNAIQYNAISERKRAVY